MSGRPAPFATVGLLFFLSGSVGLVYEVVWLRMAIRVFGCTTYATSVVLAAFMAGLALGSWLIGRQGDRAASPLRLYAALEIGAAAAALLVPWLFSAVLPAYKALHPHGASAGAARLATQAIFVFLILLVPTALMGGTLPVMGALASRARRGQGEPIATLYGLNTLGAVTGSLVSGLILLGSIGERATLLAGVLLQLAIGVAALSLARRPSPAEGPAAAVEPAATPRTSEYSDRVRRVVLLAFAASGFAGLAYEVVWTRVLPSLLLTSVYAFSGMLALYLTGIGVGSLVGRRIAARAKDPVAVLAGIQILLALVSLLGFRAINPLRHALMGTVTASYLPEFYLTFHRRLLAAAAVLLPPTLLLGAAFPLIMRAAVRDAASAAREVGQLYAMNTLGCILGSLAAGFLLIPLVGVAGTMIVLAIVNACVALLLFGTDPARLRVPAKIAWIAIPLIALVPAAAGVREPYGRMALDESDPRARIFFHNEDVAATTTAFGIPGNSATYRLCINGEGMTVLVTETKLMAYLPALIAEDPKEMLILCFGMGTTFRSAMTYGGLKVRTVELVPDVYHASGSFHADVPDLLRRENADPVVDDARNYLTLHDEKYDIITIDPPPPVDGAGVVNFYTKDFHEMCLTHLKPGGVVCLWVQPAPECEARMILRTFAETYTDVSVWSGPQMYGFYLLGSRDLQRLRVTRFQELFDRPGVLEDLREYDEIADSPEKLVKLLLSNRSDLLRFTEGAPLITDDLPRTEFPLWRRLLEPSGRIDMNAVTYARWLRDAHAATGAGATGGVPGT